jgi:serine/threonine protein phosphatase PrpC
VSGVFELGEQDTHVVVASDGLWDVMSPQSCADLLLASDEQSAEHLANKLLKQALQSFKCNDNVSVVVAVLKKQQH